MTREDALKTLTERAAHAVYVVVNGSEAHGTALKDSSDFDVLGVAVPPLDFYFGTRKYGNDGTKEVREGDLDAVVYEMRKVCRLLAGQNPNTLMMLFTREEDVLLTSAAGETLRANRDLFVTANVATTFMGYATSAIKKMGATDGPTGDMGAKRKAYVEEFGYDCKDACHLVRLLRMGEEILLTGQVNVWRGDLDADELKAIKQGQWSLERVKSEAEQGFARVKAAEQATSLPKEVNHDAVNALCMKVVELALFGAKVE